MKLFFIFYDRPNYFAGPIVNARRLLPELVKRGHDVFCLLMFNGDYSTSKQYMERRGVNCIAIQLKGFTEKRVKYILKLVKLEKPDIFIPNLSVAGWFAAKWARQAGIPTIACHRSDDEFHWAMVEEFVTGSPEWAVSGLVCVSNHILQQVKKRKPLNTQLCFIPSGVPTEGFSANHYSRPLRLVFVGRVIQQQKRILETIEGISLCINKNPEIIATIIGDGPDIKVAQNKVHTLGLQRHISFVGTIPSQNIQKLLSEHHVLVLLSDYEGTPGAVMDGMAAGLVPVCLDIPGGIQELISHKHTGLLVKNRAEDFYNAINTLDKSPERCSFLAKNAQKHILNNYSLKTTTDRWELFCSELALKADTGRQISYPRKLSLPCLKKGLAREDRRTPPFNSRIAKAIKLAWSKTISFLTA